MGWELGIKIAYQLNISIALAESVCLFCFYVFCFFVCLFQLSRSYATRLCGVSHG